jgi:signal peptidase I
MPEYIYYLAAVVGLIIFILFWLKFSPTRCLIISLINAVYGILLLFTIQADTPGLYIVLTVSSVLTIFGIWGFILWVKLTANNFRDQVNQTEDLENWWSTVRAFDIILIIGLVIRLFIVQPFIVDGISMENNFHNREAILVDKISYHFRTPIRGEVVIFIAPKSPSDDYIKRMIGLPGDKVKIVDGKVYVNGNLLNESFLTPGNQTPVDVEMTETTIPANNYFVLGDNRPRSSDSRDWGMLPKEDMIGRAVLAVYPFNMFGLIQTPNIYP